MLVYLASYPRSGNRWSRDLIEHCFTCNVYSVYSERERAKLIARFGADLPALADPHSPAFLTLALRRRIAEDATVAVLKTHELPFMEFFPGEKVIHLVRHPGASLWSYSHFLRDTEQLEVELDGLIQGKYGYGSWSQHTERWLAASRLGENYLRYSYEGLHADAAGFCAGFARLTGLTMVNSLESFPPFEVWHARRPKLARSGTASGWEPHFTKSQHRLLLQLHGQTMQKLGYAVEMPPPPYAAEIPSPRGQKAAVGAPPVPPPPPASSLLQRGKAYLHNRWVGIRDLVRWESPAVESGPTVLHITQQKAGSQWVAAVLTDCVAPHRIIAPQEPNKHFTVENLRPGAVFLTLYLAREPVEQLTKAVDFPIRQFVVIRDLRDTLVSYYFSLRYSHPPMNKVLSKRAVLEGLSVEEGLFVMLMENRDLSLLPNAVLPEKPGTPAPSRAAQRNLPDPEFKNISFTAAIQRSWITAEDRLLVRYEDLVADNYGTFRQIMDYCKIPVTPADLRKIVAANSFEARTGRKPGQEDIMAHQRKGIVGDWRNYFNDELKAEFKARYGDLLILTGYEKDLNW